MGEVEEEEEEVPMREEEGGDGRDWNGKKADDC